MPSKYEPLATKPRKGDRIAHPSSPACELTVGAVMPNEPGQRWVVRTVEWGEFGSARSGLGWRILKRRKAAKKRGK